MLVRIVPLLAIATPASANAGTPLLLLSAFHLFIGNAVIGLIEGIIIARIGRLPAGRVAAFMVAANYVSMFLGALLVTPIQDGFRSFMGPVDFFYAGERIFYSVLGIFVVLSIAIEVPFCYLGLPSTARGVTLAMRSTLAANFVSYAILIPAYWFASTSGYYDILTFDRTLLAEQRNPSWVYFLTSPGRDLYRIRSDGQSLELVSDLSLPREVYDSGHDLLYLTRASQEQPDWDLVVGSATRDSIVLIRGFLPSESYSYHYATKDTSWQLFSTDSHTIAEPFLSPFFRTARSLIPLDKHDWVISTGFWAVEGLTIGRRSSSTRLRIAQEAPGAMLAARSATLLDERTMVYQIGRDIVLIDLPTLRAAFLHEGILPMAVAI